jgi:hypothetical protein
VRETLLARSELSTRYLTSRPDYLRIYLREAERWGFDPSHLPADATAFMDLSLFERGVATGELVREDPQLLQSLVLASSQVHLSHWLRDGMREDPTRSSTGSRRSRAARSSPIRADPRVAARALVVGGTGPTGPHLVRGLRERGHAVAILHRGTHEVDEIPPDVEHIHADPYDGAASRGDRGPHFDVVVASYGGCARSRARASGAPSASSASAAFRSTAAGCAGGSRRRAGCRCPCAKTPQVESEASCARAS